MGKTIPIVDYLVLDDGAPHLVANESDRVRGAVLRPAQRRCPLGHDRVRRRRVADTGVVRTFTIVHRAAPSVPTPYVSVVVDLDGGGVVKANLLNVEPTPEAVTFGMKVRMTTFAVGVDDDGTEAIAFALRARGPTTGELDMERDVWVLGASMTKFGRYKDKDLIDLGAEAALAALDDAGVTIGDMGVMGAGNLAEAAAASASGSRSRSARPASPSTTWPTPAPPARPRCGAPTWRSRPASPTWASPSASRRWARWACSARRPARTRRCSSRRAATVA